MTKVARTKIKAKKAVTKAVKKTAKKLVQKTVHRITDGVCEGGTWLYTETVRDHFLHPRNLLIDDEHYEADGIGIVGSPACGDMMAVWIMVDPKTKRITECKWRTFGCASAIASTSMLSVMATEHGGLTLAQAKRITPEAIIDRLGGLPDRKYHCSVLGHQALREAVLDYEQSQAAPSAHTTNA